MKNNTSIEPLEPRIAPATITILGKTATWTDFDGDLVTMKWTSTDAPAFTTMDKGSGLLVSRILLDPVKHDGASFTVKVKAAGAFGDGRVELGHLDGGNVALKSWVGPKAGISEIDLSGSATGAKLVFGGLGQTAVGSFTGSMGNDTSNIGGLWSSITFNGDIGIGTIVIASAKTLTITGSIRGDVPTATIDAGEFYILGNVEKSPSVAASRRMGTWHLRTI